MTRRKGHEDVCYCDTCKHERASICIENSCDCCLKADKIRLSHPVLTDEKDLEKQESDDEEYRKGRQAAWMSDLGSAIASSE